MKPDTAPQALLAAIDADTMLREVQDWAAINTGTGNIAGLNTRYDIEHDTGRIAFTNTFFWTPGEGSSVLCTVQWSGPTETCAR